LPKVIETLNATRFAARLFNCRNQYAGKHRNDADDDEQFNQGESTNSMPLEFHTYTYYFGKTEAAALYLPTTPPSLPSKLLSL
jgi:hypothetical protein